MIGISKKPGKVAVLGAGLTGLRAADVLSENGVDVVVIEKEAYPGGLAHTFQQNGFHFDLGPHRFHTENSEILQMVEKLLPGELLELQRLSRIHLLDRYFIYPLSFGDVLKKMPLLKAAGMTMSYFMERGKNLFSSGEKPSFKEWVISRFGKKLYDLYFGPYTEKLWGCPAEKLSSDWASQRISVPKLTDLVRATVFPQKNSARSLVSKFHYPRGGIGRISEALAEKAFSRGADFIYSTSPDSIQPLTDGGYSISSGGKDIKVDGIVSTIPVTEYVELLGNTLSENIHNCSEKLHYRAIVFLVLQLKTGIMANDHWIYIPEEKYLFNRISIPGNFDAELSENGSQMVFEFTCMEDDDIWSGDRDLLESAIAGGIELELFRRDDVMGSMLTRKAHAYPVYSLEYSDNISTVLDALDVLESSVTTGRQGLFRYNNMDHSLEMGEYAALELLGRGSVRQRFEWTRKTWADG
ncbi:MAG: FAD-dependent oxidoreductase [Candidatus Aegiribacteria sp.]|nr:FAD-dependent oxidoreductase [Candidatus Aegiribacteria sp.]